MKLNTSNTISNFKSEMSNSINAFTVKRIMIVALLSALALAVTTHAQESGNRTAASGTANNVVTAATSNATIPQTGTPAPDFALPYATNERIFLRPDEQMRLSSLRGRNVVLAFYPADWSGGCTREVCTLRDTFAELSRLNVTVLGISGDYVFSHHEWAKHHNLQFPLLSDHDHRIARLYNSFDERSGFNKRTVILIDRGGVVRYVNLNFRAGEAADYNALRAELERLNNTPATTTR